MVLYQYSKLVNFPTQFFILNLYQKLYYLISHMKLASMASIYVTHGGGPMPIIYKQDHQEMYRQFEEIRKRFPSPKAIIVFSAHWEQKQWTMLDKDDPGLYFDYGGFPEESYKYKYPVKSSPDMRKEVTDSLMKNGISLQKHTQKRGYDHGVFIPLMIMYPEADIPVIQISLLKSLDPQKHFEMGKALRQLKHNGYLILGSGASIHGGFGDPKSFLYSQQFDKDLAQVCLKSSSQKQLVESLKDWRKWRHANRMHPRQQHLIPLFINLGAAEGKKQKWGLNIMGMCLSSYVCE